MNSEKNLPFGFARQYGVVAAPEQNGDTLGVYCKQGVTPETILEVRRWAGRPIAIEELPEESFDTMLSRIYQGSVDETMQRMQESGIEMNLSNIVESVSAAEDLLEKADDAPIINLINAFLTEAINENASDIHVETFEQQLVVRFRVDGVLREVTKLSRTLSPLLVSRIKVMAKLDIAEKRIPQDGRISVRIGGKDIDVRVSTLPTGTSERIVMRLLDKDDTLMDLPQLGMSAHHFSSVVHMISKPHGIILVTGPTGSGKTTTLYAALARLNQATRNILTVEDPIEYNIQGIGQTQINPKIGMSFAKGLRAILRQDPDVIMIGEIRDNETASIAVQSSMTGHLVLSTLHTNTAIGAITRLRNIGVEHFLLASTINGLISQRLVRVLCEHCKTPKLADRAECEFLHIPTDSEATIYTPAGCDECKHTGYNGRTGIYEVIEIDDTLRQKIHEEASEQELEHTARSVSAGILQDGREKVLQGLTTIEEVIRVTLDG